MKLIKYQDERLRDIIKIIMKKRTCMSITFWLLIYQRH